MSKIIVLGRPSAFMSENEKRTVLHGYQEMDGIEISDASKKDYIELDVAFFNQPQLQNFVSMYFEYVRTEGHMESRIDLSPEFIEKRKAEILDPKYSELLGRPVHARMLITIALSTKEPLATFSRFTLYKQFVKLFLDRESQKSARRKIGIKDRLLFLQQVAWESWVVNEGKSISVSAISKLLSNVHGTDDTENMLRELLTGSVLEPKGDDVFYFVHRSFQEFLAAQFLLGNSWTQSKLSTLDRSANEEILRFVAESNEANIFSNNVLETIGSYKGALSNNLLVFFGEHGYESSKFQLNEIAEAKDPWTIIAMAVKLDESAFEQEFKVWFGTFSQLYSDNVQMAFLLGVCLSLQSNPNSYDAQKISAIFIGLLHYRCEEWIRHTGINTKSQMAVSNAKEREWALVMIDAVDAKTSRNEVLSLTLDLPELGYSLLRQLAPEIELTDVPKFTMQSASAPFVSTVSYVQYTSPAEDKEKIQRIRDKVFTQSRKFWLSKPSFDDLVPIKTVFKTEPKRLTLGLKGT